MILGFHQVDDRFDFSINSVSNDKFHQIFRHLLTYSERPILLFDDGYDSVFRLHEKFPQMVKNFPCKLSVITAYIGKNSTWDKRLKGKPHAHINDQQLSILAHDGWEIISHGHSHFALDRLHPDELEEELETSKLLLTSTVGKPVTGLSFPFGRFNDVVIEKAIKLGYQTFYSYKHFQNHPMVHPVWGVYRWDSLTSIDRKISQSFGEKLKLSAINFCSNGTVWVQSLQKTFN